MTAGTDDQRPTRDEVDELLAFLPVFSAPGYEPVRQWHGGEVKDKVVEVLWPEYDEAVRRFIRIVHKDCWVPRDYRPVETGRLLRETGSVDSADIQEIRQMLTYCVRGERFCDGHLESMIKGGYVTRILKRLAEIMRPQSAASC